jgi:hypothetical protein
MLALKWRITLDLRWSQSKVKMGKPHGDGFFIFTVMRLHALQENP